MIIVGQHKEQAVQPLACATAQVDHAYAIPGTKGACTHKPFCQDKCALPNHHAHLAQIRGWAQAYTICIDSPLISPLFSAQSEDDQRFCT